LPSGTDAPTSPEQAAAPSQAEPLHYATQGRSDAPLDDRVAPPVTGSFATQSLGTQLPPAPEQPGYRVRDYSPDGRRAALSREQFASAAAPTEPVDLDYFTVASPTVHQHVATPPARPAAGSDHTLTRRELRELRAAQEAVQVPQTPEPIDAILNSGPIDLSFLSAAPGQSQALADAKAEFDALARARKAEELSADAAGVEPVAPVGPPALIEPPKPAQQHVLPLPEFPQVILPTELEQPAAEVPARSPAVAEPVDAAPTVEEVAPAAVDVPAADAPVAPPSVPAWGSPQSLWNPPTSEPVAAPQPESVAQQPVVSQPAAVEPEPVSADPVFIEPDDRAPLARPVGHWSVQAQVDDEEQVMENTMGRTVGGGSVAVTTSALILPSVPQASDFNTPFAATGEILVTGSIDLPRSLASTGAHPHRVDNSDFEDDPLDSQVASADSAPIRAIRAVSTHTSTRGVIESKRPQNNRVTTAIIVATSVLALAVAGLIVTMIVLHPFS
jgi:hypothetical protein